MHTKWQIWDFFKSFDSSYFSSFSGVFSIATPEPIYEGLVKDFFKKGAPSKTFFLKNAEEINRSWLEEEFLTLSFFQAQDCFIINHAQDLSFEILDLILGLNLNDRFIILFFESTGVGWKKMISGKSNHSLEIEPTKFWEFNKLLDFFINFNGITLNFEAKNWLLENSEHSAGSFHQVCSNLKINFDSKIINLDQVKSVIAIDRFDQFKLATLVSLKKLPEFYAKINQLNQDFDRLKDLFRFLQGHLIKLSDSSYLKGKNKYSNYDKEILKCSQLWKPNELRVVLESFCRWEIMSKKKDPQIWLDLKKTQLESEISF